MPQISISVCETATAVQPQYLDNNFDPTILYVGCAKKSSSACPRCGRDCHYHCRDFISLLRFDRISLLPHDSSIVKATLHVYVRKQKSTNMSCKESRIFVYNNLENFEGPTLCWDNKPNFEQDEDGVIAFASTYQHGYASCDITELAVDWHHGIEPNFGVSLVEASNATCIMLDSKNGAHPPYITIDYLPSPCHHDDCNCCHDSGYLKNKFVERIFHTQSDEDDTLSPFLGITSAELVSLFIKNEGTSTFEINLQMSPDGIEYVNDPQTLTAAPGELVFITPQYFAKFIRVHIRNIVPTGNITAKLWWHLQTRDYYIL